MKLQSRLWHGKFLNNADGAYMNSTVCSNINLPDSVKLDTLLNILPSQCIFAASCSIEVTKYVLLHKYLKMHRTYFNNNISQWYTWIFRILPCHNITALKKHIMKIHWLDGVLIVLHTFSVKQNRKLLRLNLI